MKRVERGREEQKGGEERFRERRGEEKEGGKGRIGKD